MRTGYQAPLRTPDRGPFHSGLSRSPGHRRLLTLTGVRSIACFISPHGFGHAARCCAVVEALSQRRPELTVHLFTTVPRWFFERSLSHPFHLHGVVTDVGLIQRNSLEEDLGATAVALDGIFPPSVETLDDLAHKLRRLRCRLVVADISPLGLAAATWAGIPSVLLENFTWDWIYRPYLENAPALARHIPWLESTFAAADHRIQARPACQPIVGAWQVPPISRTPRSSSGEIRRQLGIAPTTPMVLVTMGGVRWKYDGLDLLRHDLDATIVVPGGSEQREQHTGLVLLPHQSEFFHPDLVAAADVLIGKLGYSTVAEAYRGKAAFLFVRRPEFAESEVLERFVRAEMTAAPLSAEAFRRGHWTAALHDLLGRGRSTRPREADGAETAARLLETLIPSGGALSSPAPPDELDPSD